MTMRRGFTALFRPISLAMMAFSAWLTQPLVAQESAVDRSAETGANTSAEIAAEDDAVENPQTVRPSLAQASDLERETLQKFMDGAAWPRRAIAVLRLERFGCDQSQNMLLQLRDDPAWQVRSFAIRSLAQRGVQADEAWFVNENDPRVLRTVLRHGYTIDLERLQRGIGILARSRQIEDRMLAVELAAASGDAELIKQANTVARQIILRMTRTEAGMLSPRLAFVTGQPNLQRDFRWRQWLMKTGRSFTIKPTLLPDNAAENTAASSRFAQLDAEQFAGLLDYMQSLSEQHLDLAICLDCTASMWQELGAAQAGIDDLMLFVGDVVKSLRVGIVAYRDRHDEFETRGWNFTSDVEQARRQLWMLSADGGGDGPEAVLPALRAALTQLNWRNDASKVLVLIGDAPPHIGTGTRCVQLAQRAHAAADLTTHVVQADGKDVKHFPEIAEAGGGRCVSLDNADTLIAEIAGLTLGERYEDEFREFFDIYFELCR